MKIKDRKVNIKKKEKKKNNTYQQFLYSYILFIISQSNIFIIARSQLMVVCDVKILWFQAPSLTSCHKHYE